MFQCWKTIFKKSIAIAFKKTLQRKLGSALFFIVGIGFLLIFQGMNAVIEHAKDLLIIKNLLMLFSPLILWFFLHFVYNIFKIPAEYIGIVKNSEYAHEIINKIKLLIIKAKKSETDKTLWETEANTLIINIFGQGSYEYCVFNNIIQESWVMTTFNNRQISQISLENLKNRCISTLPNLSIDTIDYKLVALEWIVKRFLTYTIPIKN